MDKAIVHPLGAKDSESNGWEYTIPEGMEAVIKDGKIIVRKKGSEDERIRKSLLRMISDIDGGYPFENYGIIKKEAIAYLEKQKEQKPIEIIRIPKFRVGDIVQPVPLEKWDRTKKITYIDEYGYRFDYSHLGDPVSGGGFTFACEDDHTLVEQKPIEWNKEYREEDLRTRFAFYTYKDEDGVLYLSNVFVEETSRNKGFGTKILKAAEMIAEIIGATTIRLKVKHDSPANTWYRKNGYGYVRFEDEYDWLEKNLEYIKPNRQEQNTKTLDEFTRNIRDLITKKLTTTTKGPDGSELSYTVFIDDETARDIANGILFYVDKEVTKNPGREAPERSKENEEALDMCINAIPKAWKTKSGVLLTKWLKDNIRIQPKQEWNEKDEEALEFMRNHLWNLVKLQDENERMYTRCLVYLDKLKEQK